MIQIQRQACVPYTPAQMYQLVNAVDQYPLFLKGCERVAILSATPESMVATLWLRQGPFRQSFTTCNQLVDNTSIHMQLQDGPFEQFSAAWYFRPFGESGCAVSFETAFLFKHGLLNRWFQGVFQSLCQSLVKQFCDRANHVYR